MIIDFHTHSFPKKIARRALDKLSKSANMPYYLDGTLDDLKRSMRKSGVSYTILLPVATNRMQQQTINDLALAINEQWQDTGILSFGGIHPDNENYRSILRELSRNGIKGIKLHPVYQGVYIDDVRYLRIIAAACENDLIVLTHAGYDVSFPGLDYAAPIHMKSMLDQVHPNKMVLAHMGGWGNWEEVEELLTDYPIWLDTSFCLTTITHRNPESNVWKPEQEHLSDQQFLRIAHAIGEDRILFGSDSPWTSQSDSIQAIQKSGLDESSLQKIFFDTAARLLHIN